MAIAMPLLLFLIAQPEEFGLVPNDLDPFFYTGYATNLDDMMDAIGDRHYFVSRWTVYLPSYMFSSFFGPFVGRLILRWIIASIALLAIWHCGRRWSWNRSGEIVVGVVVLTSPIFARALFTDYVEWFIVGVGILLVAQCLEESATTTRSLLIGSLSGALMIANMIAILAVFLPVTAYVVFTRSTAVAFVKHTLLIAASATIIVVSGLVFFRYAFGIPNVYAPSIDFLRQRHGSRDAFKSPNLRWMGAYTWIYIPPILIATAALVPAFRDRIVANRGSRAVFVLLGLQYVVQWLDQFVRDGNGLEISYYWSFTYPAIAIATAVFLNYISWTPGAAAMFSLLWLSLLLLTAKVTVHLPGGWMFVVVVFVVASVCGVLSAQGRVSWAGGLMALFLLCTQVAAPRYDPTGYSIDTSPRYNEIFLRRNSSGERQLHEAIWLERELDRLPSDENLYFLAGGDGIAIIGVYGPHVTGRWMREGSEDLIDAPNWELLVGGFVQQIAVYGPPDFVSRSLQEISVERALGDAVLRETNAGGLGYELAVIDINDPANDPFRWDAASLSSQTGLVTGGSIKVTPEIDSPGFVTFGPFVGLNKQRYRVKFNYLSGADRSEILGFVDVSQSGQPVSTAPLNGSAGSAASVDLILESPGGVQWEFRVYWSGRAPLVVSSVQIEPAR